MTETQEETEPQAQDNTQVDDAGVPGQIQYPDAGTDAERAGEYVAGKVDSLYAEDDPRYYTGWQNPADNYPPSRDDEEAPSEE